MDSRIDQGSHAANSSRPIGDVDEELVAEGISLTVDRDELTGALGPDAVQARSDLASYLRPGSLPASVDTLVAVAEEEGAPEQAIELLRRLPPQTFHTTQEIWVALGGSVEHRTPATEPPRPTPAGAAPAGAATAASMPTPADRPSPSVVERACRTTASAVGAAVGLATAVTRSALAVGRRLLRR